MAAWQGREEPSARQGSKLDPTPARVGGVPSGGLVGWWVGREAGRSGRPQQAPAGGNGSIGSTVWW